MNRGPSDKYEEQNPPWQSSPLERIGTASNGDRKVSGGAGGEAPSRMPINANGSYARAKEEATESFSLTLRLTSSSKAVEPIPWSRAGQ